jgi:hypothetical protein
MSTNLIVEKIEGLQAFLGSLEGKVVRVNESICFSALENFDRHSTIDSYFKFTVEKSGWQFSGGHFHLYGENEKYAISTKQLEAIKQIDSGMEILERYEKHTLRKTTITII